MTTSNFATWLACAAASGLAILLLRQLSKFRNTTLAAPCLWAILSAASLALLAALEATSQPTLGLNALRFAAIATTLCPMMAVLGAKRPQDRGWQWIVFSLWVVVVGPAIQAALLPTGTQVELFVAWKLFLVGLMSLGLLNYLPTRFWLPAMLVAMGQLILFDSYLWHLLPDLLILPLAIACFLVANLIASLSATRTKQSPSIAPAILEQQWHTFRNTYGAFWALRILARVNQTAELRDWPTRLTWTGFEPHPQNTPNTLTPNQQAELAQTMCTSLRRFNTKPRD